MSSRMCSAAGIAAVLVVAGSLSACAQRAHPSAASKDGEHEIDVRDAAAEAKVSLADAIGAALAARPGAAIEAEIEGETEGGVRHVFYEVLVHGENGSVHEVKVDPATGRVTSVEAETDPEDLREVREAAAAIPAGSKSLADLVRRAEAQTGARAVAGKFEVEEGRAECEVELLNGRKMIEADVGLSDGAVRASEETDDDEHDGDDEDEGDEEDEDDERDQRSGK